MERPHAGEGRPLHDRGQEPSPGHFDLICLSHLRWNFVYQRPQHLMTRFARDGRVFYVEEAEWGDGPARLAVENPAPNLWVVVPHLPHGLDQEGADAAQRLLLDDLLRDHAITRYVLWYYTPMATGFGRHLAPLAVVYDCMDELSAFRGAPPGLMEREAELLARADLVFTGGRSLYEAKRSQGSRVYAFPSSVEAAHFAQARTPQPDPPDQATIPHPRLGFFGVIDERFDIPLVAAVAAARPDWHLVLIGPTAKVDPADLPQGDNVHYLGMKGYADLPRYLAGWDVALLPFARNESTRFISPTKTPEYLAAGVPVVSTSIRDVVRPYGDMGLVGIADEPDDFVAAVERALREDAPTRLARVDELLAQNSWDNTYAAMRRLIEGQMPATAPLRTANTGAIPNASIHDAGALDAPATAAAIARSGANTPTGG